MSATTILNFAEAGQGKSSLFETAPGPRLLLDSESRSRLLRGKKVVWDDLSKVPAVQEDTTYVIPVSNWQGLSEIGRVLTKSLPFRSYGMDSLTKIQESLMQELTKGTVPNWDHWNLIKARMEFLINVLTSRADTGAEVIYATAWMTTRDQSYVPLIDGSFKDRLPHYFEVVGRSMLSLTQSEIKPSFTIWPHKVGDEKLTTMAKANNPRLLAHFGPVIDNPNLTDIHQVNTKEN